MTAKRVDANQRELTALFRRMGVSVLILSGVGKGCPDLLLGAAQGLRNVLVEVKDGTKPPSQRKLTPLEQKFLDEWQGDVRVISSLDEALALVNELRRMR